MFVESSVTRVEKDGTRVLTNEVEPDDTLDGTTYEDLVEHQAQTRERGDWVRTDALDSTVPTIPTAPAPVVMDVTHPARPSDDDSKSVWWTYAKTLGFASDDYDHVSKAQLIRLYGDIDASAALGA